MKNSKIAFFIPCAGLIHQSYLKRLYDGIQCYDKFIITHYKHKNGWCDSSYKCITLYPRNILLKIISKIKKNISNRSFVVNTPPAGYVNILNKVFCENKIDLLHFVYAGGAAGVIPFLKKNDVKFTINFAGSDVQVAELYPWYMRDIVWLWNHAACCTFASNFLMKQALRNGCPKEKARVMYLGTPLDVERNTVSPVRNYIQFISVGNLLEVKGHKYLIKSFAKVKSSLSNCRLVIVGEGPERASLEFLLNDLRLNDSVRLTGTVDKPEVNKLLLESDIYVQPSIRTSSGEEEGLPQATLEAMTAKLPIIVFGSGGLNEIIYESHNGFVIPEKDTNTLADKMCMLATNISLREMIGINAYKTVCGRFSVEKCNKNWNSLFEEIINKYTEQ